MKISITVLGQAKETIFPILDEYGVNYQHRGSPPRVPLSRGPVNTGTLEFIEVVGQVAEVTPYGALAAALYAWLSFLKSRKAQVTMDNGEVKSFSAEGFSEKEIQKILEGAKHAALIPGYEPEGKK